ncbi:MAG: type II methionyl aminopeptidase [Candidatus ainarchaeum sp.]|nr:type II methionyl aminopeptidase [Candidatus ainarchaeum sp.]
MDSSEVKSYKEAGVVWAKAIKYAQKKAKDGLLLFDLAEGIEKLIVDEGAQIGFPVNLSINEQAAHFTPKFNDTNTLKESDVLKVDLGTAVNGFICDGAITINLNNEHAKQIEANELALANAISVAKLGEPVEKMGAIIEKTLKDKGFNPVYNLGGHGVSKNNIHDWPSVPNHSGGTSDKLKEGVAVAIEPFASTGVGEVRDDVIVEIFSLVEKKGVRSPVAKQILNMLDKYEGRPFAERWIRKELDGKVSDFGLTLGLKELMKNKSIHTYPGLKEAKGTIVTQIEKTIIINDGETIVLGE